MFSGALFAATIDLDGDGTITEYTVTINKLEIYNSTTSEWFVLSDTPKSVNIASVTAGNAVGSMIKKDLTLKYGSYTTMRATVSGTFTLNACYDTGNTCTTGSYISGNEHASYASNSVANRAATEVIVDFNDCGGCMTSPAPPSGESRSAVSGGVAITYTLATPFTMDATTASMVSNIQFDVDDKLTYVSSPTKYISPAFPGVTLSVQ
ncbi:MAG: hypothetical protein K0U08_04195 [Proteobacteria bacterium]|nr:hypothetical protein [Pseudomonadota bacterium]MCH9750034.1 hypothetical protein [Pseudomonadota bacterium]